MQDKLRFSIVAGLGLSLTSNKGVLRFPSCCLNLCTAFCNVGMAFVGKHPLPEIMLSN